MIPFKISNPEEIPPGKSWTITEEDLKQIQYQHDELITIRGKTISIAVLIEEKLNNVISSIVMGNNANLINHFNEIFLEKEFFTFMNKWKILKELCDRKEIAFENEETKSEVLKSIKESNDIRNNFAHGEIVFSGTKPILRYVKEGKKFDQPLVNEYFDIVNDVFIRAYNYLDSMYKHLLGDKYQEAKHSEKQEEKAT